MIDVPFFTSFGGIDLQPGPQNLDGAHALAFVRCRMEYATGDFQRAANQRALLKAVAKKILQEPPGNIPGLVQSSTACIKTDLTANQLIDLVGAFRGMDLDADMYTGQVPSTTMMLDEISYVITVEDQWAGVREKYVNGEVPFVNASNQPDVVD
jgi:anionic cell wall polymer biosynthesis LytR-Cps2A-Psr (LCP) family protein